MTQNLASLIDTHCHLTFNAFNKDRLEVIGRAKDVGVHKIVIPGTSLESSREAVILAEAHPELFAAVGIHPHNARHWDDTYKEALMSLADSPKVIAIGEIGLDYYRDRSPHDVQREVFQNQLDLAAELDLPVIVHNREATEDVMERIQSWATRLNGDRKSYAGVLHAYSADLDTASKAVDAGFYIGVAGPITYHKADELRKTVANVPTSRMLVETDSPYLTPHPYRSKRNEPANVTLVAEQLSTVIGSNLQEIAQSTSHNAMKLFGFDNGTYGSILH
ncbi:MAG: YchF/TatD family DNA exonuclease [Anaerolineales bacterium]|nr:YchF/TatD family DNA exonuclease [Anaerolineales bacterium]